MANCIKDIINNISVINTCKIGLGGLRKVYVSTFDTNIYSNLTIVNGQITNIAASVKFSEIDFDNTVSFFSQKFNYDLNAYELILTLQLLIVDPDKRSAIDALIKANLVFLIQDNNNKWFMIGEKTGAKSFSFDSTTDVHRQKSIYNYSFLSKSDSLPFSVDPEIIDFATTVDCSELDLWRFQNSTDLYWYKYRDCIVHGII